LTPCPPRRLVPRAPGRLPARVRAHAQQQRRPPPVRQGQRRAPPCPMRHDIALGLASAMLSTSTRSVCNNASSTGISSRERCHAGRHLRCQVQGLWPRQARGTSQPYTTVLVGTLGYLAPECVTTVKARVQPRCRDVGDGVRHPSTHATHCTHPCTARTHAMHTHAQHTSTYNTAQHTHITPAQEK
jgi:hypothetical protein